MKKTDEIAVDGLYRSVRKVIEQGRQIVSIAANTVLVRQNWNIGRLIVEDEQHGRRKADYGKRTLFELSARLIAEYGTGFDERNLRYMRSFYLAFPIWNAVRSELGWTHYRILMREEDPIAREWYMNECVAGGWGTRDLDRQVCGKDDNPTVGIVLCDETDAAIARYSVLHDNRNMFAVKYSTVMPSDEVLRREIEVQKELYRLQMEEDRPKGRLGTRGKSKKG